MSASPPPLPDPRPPGVVRPIRASDVPGLARLYMAVFRRPGAAPPPQLERHLRALFLEHPRQCEACVSLVHARADGAIDGLFGSLPAPMLFDGRPITGSIISTWMVAPGPSRASAATRLVRAHLKRGHDITLTNTANATSMSMQESLRFRYASHYSLEWFRVLNGSVYAASVLARRAGGRLPAWLARGVDAPERAMLAARGARPRPPPGWRVNALDAGRFAERVLELTRRFRLRPDWSVDDLTWMLGLAAERAGSGPVRLCEALDEKGRLAGAFGYYAPPMGRGETIQLVARRNGESEVLRAFIADADERKCAYVCGPAGPLIVRGLFGAPRVFFRQTAGTAFRSNLPGIADAVAYGDGLIGGLVGDGWTPLSTQG